MKRPKDVAELEASLHKAATTPLVAPAAVIEAEAAPPATMTRIEKPKKPRKESTAPLLLRLPQTLYDDFDGEAVKRTKATGRGVSIQQIIIERLSEGSRA